MSDRKQMSMCCIATVALLCAAGVCAEHVGWVNDAHGGDGVSWGDPLNWWSNSGVSRIPTINDDSTVGWSVFGPSTAVVGSGVHAENFVGWIGTHSDGTVTIDAGGSYTTQIMGYMGYLPGITGTLNVNGGTADFSKKEGGLGVLLVGEDGNGILNINDGLVKAYSLEVSRQPGSSGHIQLNGGLLDLVGGEGSRLLLYEGEHHNAGLDITGGELRLDNTGYAENHWMNVLTGYIDNGMVTAYGNADRNQILIVDTGPYTKVTALQEPIGGPLAIAGDFNEDGKVDYEDLVILCEEWLSSKDMNHYALMSRNWDATWLTEGAYGVMVHYLLYPQGATEAEKTQSLNNTVNCFDVDTFLMQFKQSGADWLIFTLGQNSGYYCSSNDFLDTHLPGRTPDRDIAMEIAQGLDEMGKKLILYLPAEVSIQSQDIKNVFAWNPGNQSEFINRYRQFVSDYSEKFGDLCHGWWFDGCYDSLHTGGDAYWQQWIDAAKSGNPDSFVAFNDGAFCVNKIPPVTTLQDYHAGEVHMLENGMIRTDYLSANHTIYTNEEGYLRAVGQEATFHMPDSRFIDGVQWHALVPINSSFNAPYVPVEACQYSDSELVSFVLACKAVKGAVTFNVPVGPCGIIPPQSALQLKNIGQGIYDGQAAD